MPETDANSKAPQSEADHNLLREAVIEAGNIARHYFEHGFEHWQKGVHGPVTEADLAVDKALKEQLIGARPDYGWLSEETEDDKQRLSRDSVWIVDPIDGTRAFVEHRPQFTICAALVHKGHPIAGIVYNPVTDDLYEAQRDKGAKLNGEPMSVTSTKTLEGASVLSSKGMFKHPNWQQPWPALKISMRNSVALRLALVASGEYDMCLSLTKKSEWDIAAADLIVREAGGKVTDHLGNGFIYNQKSIHKPSLIAVCPGLYENILSRTKVLTLAD